MREFQKSDFGLDALPLLRRVLAEDDATMVIHAAECIAKLGPEAATCKAGEASQPIADAHVDHGDLFEQLSIAAHRFGRTAAMPMPTRPAWMHS